MALSSSSEAEKKKRKNKNNKDKEVGSPPAAGPGAPLFPSFASTFDSTEAAAPPPASAYVFSPYSFIYVASSGI